MDQTDQHIIQKVQESIIESLHSLASYAEQEPNSVLSALQNIVDYAQQIEINITGNSVYNSSDNA